MPLPPQTPTPPHQTNNQNTCHMDVEMSVNVGCQIHDAVSVNVPNVEPRDGEDGDGDDMLVDYDDDDDDDDEEKDSSGEEHEDEDEGDDEDEDEDEAQTDNKGEFILVKLADIRKEVQCPICLGIIRKTRTVMECLHRFCRECIDKSMRLGNNECPACRTHCASRRSLRDDPNYDALIAALYPDIDQYEEDEMSFQQDEIERNKQIQAAIAQTFRRQTEALSNKKKKRAPATYRRRKNYRSEDEEEGDANNANDGVKDLSSADERCSEIRSKRSKRFKGQPSSAGHSAGGGVNEDEQEANKGNTVAPVGLIGSPEMLAWGKGGIRSNTRHGNEAGANSKQNSRSRLAKLGDHLRNLEEYESELEIQVVLIPLDRQKASAVHHPYLSSRPSLSVGQLCQYIALQTSLAPERVEILAEKGPCSKLSSLLTLEGQLSTPFSLEAYKDDFHVLDSEETLAGLREATNSYQGHLMLAYREKAST